uniref:Phosphodiesterase n=3 Tax=Macrostomum lignano TaxID=282301 RepID=A0A1I8I4F0_9PLAT
MLESGAPQADMHQQQQQQQPQAGSSLPVLAIEPLPPADSDEEEDQLPDLPGRSWPGSGSVGGSSGGAGVDAAAAALASSRRGSLYIFRQSDEVIVTPFAQVLHTLRSVYDSVRTMTSGGGRPAPAQNHSSSRRAPAGDAGSFADNHLAEKTLKDLEWCLEQLETVQTHRSVADMASSKFKKMLKIELERMSSWPSSTGATSNQIESYITSTFLEKDDDDRTASAAAAAAAAVAAAESLEPSTNSTSGTLPDTQRSPASAPSSSPAEASGARGTMTKVPVRPAVLPPTPTEGPLPPRLGVETPHAEQLSELFAQSLGTWGLDIFLVDRLSCQHPLVTVVYAIAEKRDFFNKFRIHPSTLVNYFLHVEQHYKQDNPYHNAVHAADVTQSTHVLLNAQALDNVFSDLEILASIFACAIHDVNHPGVTNQFLINTENELAIMYNDASVLENHHCAVAFKLLQEPNSNILRQLEDGQRKQLRKMVIDMVLATDMSKHMSLLADLKTMVETKKVAGGCLLKLDNYSEKMQIMQNMVHCADLSNPAKPMPLSSQWVTRVMEEFFSQGDREKALGLPVSPMCCRETANVEKSQVSFIDFIVHPLWEAWTELVHPDAEHILNTLEGNRDHYSELSAAKEAAAAAKAGQET